MPPAMADRDREPAVALAREVDGRRGAARAQPRPARRRRRPHARGPARAQGRLAPADRPSRRRGLLAWRAAYPFNLDAGLDPGEPAARDRHRAGRARTMALGRPAPALGARARPRPPRCSSSATPRGIPDVPGHGARHRGAPRWPRCRGSWARTSTRGASAPTSTSSSTPSPGRSSAGRARRSSSRAACGSPSTHPCERCAIPTRDPDTREKWPELLRHLAAAHRQDFGLLARVRVPGRVAAGEPVRIVTA